MRIKSVEHGGWFTVELPVRLNVVLCWSKTTTTATFMFGEKSTRKKKKRTCNHLAGSQHRKVFCFFFWVYLSRWVR